MPSIIPKPAKVGLDDFLVEHGPHALRELLAAVVDPTPPETVAWEGPPVELVAVPQPEEFPIAVFPFALQQYISEGAKALNCPPDYFAVPMLAVAGGCIGNSRWLNITNTHQQSARLFACVVGGKGTAKSPALKLVREPLDKAQRERKQIWKREMAEWQKMNVEDRGPPPVMSRVIVGDATTESLSILLDENPRGLMLVRDELAGLLAGMNQYKKGAGHDRQWYLEVWGHALAPRDRKTDKGPPALPDRPFIGIVGSTQPDVVKRFRGEPRGGAAPPDDGFVDRWLFSFPAELPAAGETWLEISPDAKAAWDDCVRRLLALAYQADDDGERRPGGFAHQLTRLVQEPVFLRLSADGRAAWQAFTDAHAAEMNSPDSPDFPDHLKGLWAKLRGYCGCLALIVHLLHAADDRADVDAEAVNRAAELVSYFKSHARRVYAMMDADPRIKAAKRILAWIIREGRSEFKRWELHKDVASDGLFPTPDSLDRPLELLEAHGYIRKQREPHGGVGRPPAPSYIVNPLWERRENRENRDYSS